MSQQPAFTTQIPTSQSSPNPNVSFLNIYNTAPSSPSHRGDDQGYYPYGYDRPEEPEDGYSNDDYPRPSQSSSSDNFVGGFVGFIIGVVIIFVIVLILGAVGKLGWIYSINKNNIGYLCDGLNCGCDRDGQCGCKIGSKPPPGEVLPAAEVSPAAEVLPEKFTPPKTSKIVLRMEDAFPTVDTTFQVAEVEVWSGDRKLTTGELTATGDLGYGRLPDVTIDQNLKQDWASGSVWHLSPNLPMDKRFLQIQLKEPTVVTQVVVFNRSDVCCTSRLNNIQLHLFDAADKDIARIGLTGESVQYVNFEYSKDGSKVERKGFAAAQHSSGTVPSVFTEQTISKIQNYNICQKSTNPNWTYLTTGDCQTGSTLVDTIQMYNTPETGTDKYCYVDRIGTGGLPNTYIGKPDAAGVCGNATWGTGKVFYAPSASTNILYQNKVGFGGPFDNTRYIQLPGSGVPGGWTADSQIKVLAYP